MGAPYFVLGSNSFSGASFCAYLLQQGHQVIGASRSDEPHDAFLPYKWDKSKAKNFQFHKLDINHDLDGIIDVLNAEKPTHVVNFASQSMVSQSWDNPGHWFHTNGTSTVLLHDALRKLPFMERYIHISTPEVYGNTAGFIREDHRFDPSTPYAVSRAAGDLSLMSFFKAYKFPVLFTRAANVYGPGQQLYRIMPRTILFALTKKTLQLHGGGVSERSFIHMDDVSAATLLIAQKGTPGETYHISTKRLISIRDLVHLICDKVGIAFGDLVENAEERMGKDATYGLDDTKLRETLGWSDKISLETGIDQTIAWVKENLETLQAQPQAYIHKA